MQTRCCFHQVSETGVVLSCFICEASLWCVFTFVDPRHHIATSYTWPFVLHHWCAHRSRPLPPSHFLHLRLRRHRGQGSQEAVTIFPQTQSHRCQRGDWFSLPPSFSFLLFFWPYPLFILSISLSLSGTDLWDQPSKTDSEFFTDHECVSSYATEAAMERKKGLNK